MTAKTTNLKRFLALALSFLLAFGGIPAFEVTADAATIERVDDETNFEGWKNYYPITGTLSTENAGGIWTNKNVLGKNDETGTGNESFAYNGGSISPSGDNFLVALSAIGSNMAVTGMSGTPMDTIFVLDLSSSMSTTDATNLVTATNQSITALLSGNGNTNRVGVVLYSGDNANNSNNERDAAMVVLPLGRYTAINNNFLTFSNNRVKVADGVVDADKKTYVNNGKTLYGATYIQKGLEVAKDEFTKASNVIDPAENRTPVVVLMSDGAPSLADTNWKNPGANDYNIGNGGSGGISTYGVQLAFTTQLTAVYMKDLIKTHYGKECLFYTLGIGQATNDAMASNVLNPGSPISGNTTTAISNQWKNYNNAEDKSTLTIYRSNNGNTVKQITVDAAYKNSQKYVTGYFAANDSSDMIEAFEKIVAEINLQSAYHPTLVEGAEEFSGYVTFVDQLGEYMNVKDVKGIVIGNKLYSGADFAKNADSTTGAMGSLSNPTELGEKYISSIMQRLGFANTVENRNLVIALLQNAMRYEQINYVSASDFSNYIGWYAKADGSFGGFYQEGVTVLPADAANTIKSYAYWGEDALGDMVYLTVRVTHNVATGEETVALAIPASILPVVSYAVELNADETVKSVKLSDESDTEPIHFIYEVGLSEDINDFNFYEKVDADYIAANTVDGKVNFYTNAFDDTLGYGTKSTYSYFRPSHANNRYYYQENTYITDAAGNKVTSVPAEAYHQSVYYTGTATGGTKVTTHYDKFQSDVLSTPGIVQTDAEGYLYVPAGTVRRDYMGVGVEKNPNATGTLKYAVYPFADIRGMNSLNDPDHSAVYGTVLGSNGKLSYTIPTGIKIAKAFEGTGDDGSAYNFTLTGAVADGNYTAEMVAADGTETATTVAFANGEAKVALKAGESIVILGLPAGAITVSEEVVEKFVLTKVDGAAAATNSKAVTLTEGNISEVTFTNALRGMGNFTLTKVVEAPAGIAVDTAKEFNFTVEMTNPALNLSGKTYTAAKTGDAAFTSVTVGTGSTFNVTLKHNEVLEVYGLPAETVVKVTETNVPAGYAPAYWVNGAAATSAEVTIEAGNNAESVIVVNSYEPERVWPVSIDLGAEKVLTGRDWLATDEFTFRLEKQTAAGWVQLGNAVTVKGDDASKAFAFADVFGATGTEEYTAPGAYTYRIVEEEPVTPIPGVDYDKALHSFTVYVTDATLDGKLEIDRIEPTRDNTTVTEATPGNFEVDITFTNTYSATSANGALEIHKKVINESESDLATLDGFSFKVYSYDLVNGKGAQVIPEDELTTSVTGNVRLTHPFDTVGTFYFAIEEEQGTEAGWEYSKETKYISVVVTDDNAGQLVAKAYEVDKDGNALVDVATATSTAALTFTNIYDPTDVEINLNMYEVVRKQMQGMNLINSYTFGVFQYFPETKHEATAPSSIGTSKVDSDENLVKVEFDKALTFNEVGTFFFNIKETSDSGNGVTKDETVYRMVVTVTDNAGQLEATYYIADQAQDTVTFVNIYFAAETEYAISGNKVLTGRPLINDEFTFVMQQVDANSFDANPVGAAVSTTNTIEGKFTFPAITYTEPDEYYYIVSEKQPAKDENTYGVEYDKRSYLITVNVTDNGEGQLVASGNDGANVVFTNVYTPADTNVNIPGGDKVLESNIEGKVLASGDYKFQLYTTNEDWNDEQALGAPVTNADNGKFEFPNIKFTSADLAGTTEKSFYYVVREVNEGKPGVTYDTASYRIRIDLKDDHMGNLVAITNIFTEDGVPTDKIEFINTYTVSGTAKVTLSGEKVLTGRTLVDGEFTFELYKAGALTTVAGEKVKETTNANGAIAFELTYNFADVGKTYNYVIKEQNAGQVLNNVTYSSTEYYVEVKVVDNGKGGVATETTVTKNLGGSVNLDEIDFTNSYKNNDRPPYYPPKDEEDKNPETGAPVFLG